LLDISAALDATGLQQVRPDFSSGGF